MRHWGTRSEVNIVDVSQSVGDDPNVSIPRRSLEWRISHEDPHLKVVKVQIIQELKPSELGS